MFDNLRTTVIDSNDEELESAFGDEKTKKKPVQQTKPTEKKTTSKPKPVLDNNEDINTPTGPASDEELENAFSVEDEETEPDEQEDKPKKKVKKVIKEEDEDTDPEEDEPEEDEPEEDEPEEDEPEEEEETEGTPEDIKDFIKARVNLLLKKGEWADWEGSDETDWDEDTFAEMELQQRAYQKTQLREELLESFGPYGKEIAEYGAKGGDPDKLIDIFKEQQRVDSLGIATEEEQRAVVMKYETEFLNKKPERVKKYIDSLIADKDLEAEAKEAKKAMEEALVGQAEQLQADQDALIQQRQKRQKEGIEKFQKDTSSIINALTDVPAEEKKQLLNVLTKFDKKLKDGTPVNEFYSKFEAFRKDLPNYIKLVRFVLNPEKFIKTIKNDGKTEANQKAFSLAKSANKSKKVKSSSNEEFSRTPIKSKFKLM